MAYPYIDGYAPMIEMFPEHGEPISIDSGVLENSEPCVVLNEVPLTENEVQVLIRHLIVNLEHARHLYYEKNLTGSNRTSLALVEGGI